jgi:hypothetical protein
MGRFEKQLSFKKPVMKFNHKTHFTLLFLSIILLSVLSCKKDKKDEVEIYTCATCKTTPDALAANNSLSKGIYKGVVIGSTGTIKFDIANNGSTITAVMVLDGVTVNLTSSVSLVAGQTYTAPFTGTLNGSPVSITFSVGSTGQTPTITTSSIPGHPNASFLLSKEVSTALMEAYVGTYSTTTSETGIFNIVLSRSVNLWGAIARKDGGSSNSFDNGTIVNNALINSNGTTVGTLSGDALNGKFTGGNGIVITITGKRTL